MSTNMFFTNVSKKFQYPLSVHKLSGHAEEKEWVKQASIWTESKWGYLRKNIGVEERMKLIHKLRDSFYIVTYGKQPIGMFALIDYKILEAKQSTKELMYFYVEESFRDMGIGSKMFKMAKEVAKSQGSDIIVFDTLTPNLNGFYKKQGATQVCESQLIIQHNNQLLRYPTTQFRVETTNNEISPTKSQYKRLL